MKKIIVTIVAVCITTASLKAQQSLKRLEDYTGTPEYNTIVTNYLIGNIFDSIVGAGTKSKYDFPFINITNISAIPY